MILNKAQVLVVGMFLLAQNCLGEPPPAILWSRPLNSFCSSTAAVAADGTIYVGTGHGKLYALDANGKTKWIYETHSEIVSSPAVATDGTIYFGCRDHALHALTPNGKRKWRFETGAWVDASPAVENDRTIYFGSWDKKFYALKPDGAKKWEFSTGGEIVSSPAIAVDGTIYFGSHDKKFYALNPDGSKKWEFAAGGQIISSPAITSAGVIHIAANERMLFVSPQGASNTVLHADTDLAGAPVLVENGDTITGDLYGNLYSLKPDGSCRWRDRLGFIFFASPTVDAKGNILIADNGDHFLAFKNGVSPAAEPWPMFRHDLRHTGKATR